MNKPITLGGLLASLFPKSNRALSEKLSTEEYNELSEDVQALNSRLTSGPVADAVQALTVTAEQASKAGVAQADVAEIAPTPETSPESPETTGTTDPAEITLEEEVTPAAEATAPVANTVPMESLTVAELNQLRTDAAAWNAAKGEYAVLKDWYTRSTAKVPVGGAVDAADVPAGKGKSWEKAPWNTK